MNCYDCDLTGDNSRAAIGICSRCCLVVCTDHGHVLRTLVHQVKGTGRSTSAQPARRVVCQTCYGAEHSV